jgi:hypothetical protein
MKRKARNGQPSILEVGDAVGKVLMHPCKCGGIFLHFLRAEIKERKGGGDE